MSNDSDDYTVPVRDAADEIAAQFDEHQRPVVTAALRMFAHAILDAAREEARMEASREIRFREVRGR